MLQPKPVLFSERFRTVAVTRGDLVHEVLATGNVNAVTTVQVGAEISGRIATVEVDYNSPVKAGQVMARFDRAALESQLAQATGEVEAADAALQQTKTDQDHALLSLDRAERLHKNQLISEADYEAVVANARLAAQRVTAAQSQLAAKRGAAKLVRTNLDHATIVAPINGIVITRNIDPGQTVASALQTPVLFTVAQDLRKMRVIAAVDEADVGQVIKNQHATFTVDAYPDRIFEGTVTEVRNSPVVVQDVVTYGTQIDVDNLDLALKPGMTTSVHVRIGEVRDVLKIPASAFQFTPPGEKAGGAPGVWTLSPDNKLVRVLATPGLSDGESTEIKSGALQAGDKVIVDFTPEGRKAYGLGA
ncbi:MAG TPA: efflux RND transporter periplasmic adaptor subunit [Micropepsaceae bacterium]|nr:efflux RND transporter periplasmic adaptor subunit [Micropepsaceae bacterium]